MTRIASPRTSATRARESGRRWRSSRCRRSSPVQASAACRPLSRLQPTQCGDVLASPGSACSASRQLRESRSRISTFEPNIDRYGSDYRYLDLARPVPDSCMKACLGDRKCRAWSYVRASRHSGLPSSSTRASILSSIGSSCCLSLGAWLTALATNPSAYNGDAGPSMKALSNATGHPLLPD